MVANVWLRDDWYEIFFIVDVSDIDVCVEIVRECLIPNLLCFLKVISD